MAMDQEGDEVHLKIENVGTLRVSLVDGEAIGLEAILEKIDARKAIETAVMVNKIGEALEKDQKFPAATNVYLVAFELALKSQQHLNAMAFLINVGLSQKRANQLDDALNVYRRVTVQLSKPQTQPILENQRISLLTNVAFNTALLHLARKEPLEAERAAEWCLDLVRDKEDDYSKSLRQQCEITLQDAQNMRKAPLPKAGIAIVMPKNKPSGKK